MSLIMYNKYCGGFFYVAVYTFKKVRLHWFWTVYLLQNYEHLFKANEKSVGGSFYLQSKVSSLFFFSPKTTILILTMPCCTFE